MDGQPKIQSVIEPAWCAVVVLLLAALLRQRVTANRELKRLYGVIPAEPTLDAVEQKLDAIERELGDLAIEVGGLIK